MHVLVAGATGRLGTLVTEALQARGHRVRAFVRDPARLTTTPDDVVVGDLTQPNTLAPACTGVDAVVSAAGASLALRLMPGSPTFRAIDYRGNRNLLRAAEAADVHRFVYVSVWHDDAMLSLGYVRAHASFETELQTASLPYTILRPTGFFSAFEVFLAMARAGFAPMIGTGDARTNPIHDADLATLCADALADSTDTLRAVGGPDIVTRRQLTAWAFEAVGKPPRYFRVPGKLMGFNRRVVRLFDPRLAQLLGFFRHVATHDVVAPCAGRRSLRDYFAEHADREP